MSFNILCTGMSSRPAVVATKTDFIQCVHERAAVLIIKPSGVRKMKKIVNVIVTSAVLGFGGQAVAADGQAVYQKSCQSCHASGVAGAPKLGDKEAWAPRIATGMDAMFAVAISGKGAMPPKGACMDCSDDDLKAAIEYMVSQSK